MLKKSAFWFNTEAEHYGFIIKTIYLKILKTAMPEEM